MVALALEWREAARTDLLAIIDYISDENPELRSGCKDEVEDKVSKLLEHPKLYRAGRVAGTRDMVIRPNYVVVAYAEATRAVVISRVLHAAQQWPLTPSAR